MMKRTTILSTFLFYLCLSISAFAYEEFSADNYVSNGLRDQLTLNLKEGWNLISCPFLGVKPNKTTVLQGMSFFDWKEDSTSK